MCLGIPSRILEINNFEGIVEIGKIKRTVYMHLVPEVKIGQYVLVHAGCAIEIVDEEEAFKNLRNI